MAIVFQARLKELDATDDNVIFLYWCLKKLLVDIVVKIDFEQLQLLCQDTGSEQHHQLLRTQYARFPARYTAWYNTMLLLNDVMHHKDANHMDANSLAVTCGLRFLVTEVPNEADTLAEMQMVNKVVKHWLEHTDELFVGMPYNIIYSHQSQQASTTRCHLMNYLAVY
jgi:hypothetical protein